MKKRIYFVNGSLGSGKTTLINQLILSNKLPNLYIIENEYSSFSVDNMCLHLDPKQIKVLSGECICCKDPKELLKILYSLINTHFENIVIESSGVASLNDLLRSVLLDNNLENHFEISACVYVLDAVGYKRANTFDMDISDFRIATKTDILNEVQKENFSKFVFESKLEFYIKNSELDDSWINKLILHAPKSIRQWRLAVSDKKVHGENFIKVLTEKDLVDVNFSKSFSDLEQFKILRVKGFVFKDGKVFHVEATPEQCRIEENNVKDYKIGLVIIGENKVLLDEFVKLHLQ